MTKIYLGNVNEFTKFPHELELNNSIYFLNIVDNQYKLFTSICPHQGGRVYFEEGSQCFECEIHRWKFNIETGESYNSKKQRLEFLDVEKNGEDLYITLRDEVLDRDFNSDNNDSIENNTVNWPTLKLHSHACIELQYNNFSLLCDPWLSGPAFLGAWIQYPPPVIDPVELQPNAIWISHEHSDHFHEPTLNKFDRLTPVYIPDFANERMKYRLKKLGFKRIIPIPFGVKVKLYKDLSITLFEPESLWNDAIILIETQNFKLLNINDAGINHKISKQIGPVDMVASSFSPGASGYPLTWNHLDEKKKEEIMISGQQGMLSMLKMAMDTYGAKYVLPFASHFELWHPSHRQYANKLKKNSLNDVIQFFSGSKYKVIDLLPGEIWEGENDLIKNYIYDREEIFEKASRIEYVEKTFDESIFSEFYPKQVSLKRTDIVNYFSKLNEVPEIQFCEDIIVKIEVMHGNDKFTSFLFRVLNGKLTFDSIQTEELINLTIQIPEPVLAYIITNNESWDEATIGYWCNFSRDPDVYHAGFWRLLQAPYYKKSSTVIKSNNTINKNTVIADLLEKYGESAGRILSRYGLYCFGCYNSTNETIEIGAKSHGLGPNKTDKLIKELKSVLL